MWVGTLMSPKDLNSVRIKAFAACGEVDVANRLDEVTIRRRPDV